LQVFKGEARIRDSNIYYNLKKGGEEGHGTGRTWKERKKEEERRRGRKRKKEGEEEHGTYTSILDSQKKKERKDYDMRSFEKKKKTITEYSTDYR